MIQRILFLIMLLLMVAGCQNGAETAVTPTAESPAQATRDPNCAWFDCGTLLEATPADWANAHESNQLATAASFADAVWPLMFGTNVDLAIVREQPEYRMFVEGIHDCINVNLVDGRTVKEVGAECALSVPVAR